MTDTKIDLSKLKTAATATKEPTPTKVEVNEEAVMVSSEPEAPAIKYQHYKSSRISMRMITPSGGRIEP